MNVRTMQRWAAGLSEPPDSILPKLLALAKRRREESGNLVKALTKAVRRIDRAVAEQ